MSNTENQFVDTGGGRLYYESSGNGAPVVLIHSGITDSRMWDAQFSTLSGSYRAIRYDLRGFGRSIASDQPYSHVDDLISLLDDQAIEQAHLGAASMGGAIALDFALACPGRVRSLFLVGPTISGAAFEAQVLQETWQAMAEAQESGDIEKMIELEIRVWIDGPSRWPNQAAQDVREKVRLMQRAIYADPPYEELEIEPERPAVHFLHELQLSVMVVVGEHDVEDIQRNVQLIAERVGRAKLAVIDAAAHLPNMEYPELVSGRLLEFLASVESQ